MILKNTLQNLIFRAFSASNRSNRRLKRRNSGAEQLETRALLAVFTVTLTADTTAAGTLRHAIDQANTQPGDDEIKFDVATNGTEILLAGTQFQITDSLTITGNGANDTIINAQTLSRIFDITNTAVNVSISGVTLKNGQVSGGGSQQGGAIRSAATGTLSISSSVLSTNTVDDTTGSDAFGGAVFVSGGSLTVFASTISGNTANWGGAIYAAGESDVSITVSNVDGNFATNDGGAVYAGFAAQGDVTITGSTLENNTSQVRGGAIRADNVTITGGTLNGNTATTEGGAIHADGNVSVTNSTVSENTSSTEGGAIHAGGNVTVTSGSTINDNTANGNGGAIFSVGSTEVTNSTISGNATTGDNAYGGAIFASSGAVTISQSTLSGNSTAGSNADGGAIFAYSGAVTISQSTLSGNSTAGSSAEGGAIYANTGAVTISQSTLSGNSTAGASAEGGAILASYGAVTINQSTLSGNSTAGSSSEGGAIYAYTGAVSISQSTLTLNNADESQGGAIFSYSSPVTIRNTIVAGNTGDGTAPDVRKSQQGDVLTVTNSLIGRNNGTGLTATVGTTPGANGNLIGGDNAGAAINPQLGPLVNNGGPTQTHALLATSPAINRGSNALAVDPANGNSPLTTDQRGNPFPRIASTTVDMGAYEFFTGPLVVSTNVDESDGNFSIGDLSLREAIELANSSSETNTITFAPFLTGTISITSELLVTDNVRIIGPGASRLSVSGGNTATRIFHVNNSDASLINVAISGLTIRDAGDGTTEIFGAGLLSVENLTLQEVAVLNNDSATTGGGGIAISAGSLLLMSSLVSGNRAHQGGGIEMSFSAGSATIINSTISGNFAKSFGGGIEVVVGTATLRNSTITGNRADIDNSGNENGGGVDGNAGLITLHNSIVADNFQGTGSVASDVGNTLVGSSSFNLIGDAGSAGGLTDGLNGNIVGNSGSGTRNINTILNTTLSSNGGHTLTHALVTGSPAINKGSNALAVDAANGNAPLTTDQRGNPFPRIASTTVDMGAYEFFTGPLVVSTNVDESDGDFSSGDLSLREAILLANSSPETNTITFATSTNGTEFDLTLLEMLITETLTITGNGATNTVIDAQQLSRIFNFQAGDFTLNGVTLKNGLLTGEFSGGGAIRSSSTGQLTVQNSTLSGNSTSGFGLRGGAISATAGAVAVDQSTLSDNSTFGSYGEGGAIHTGSGALTISRSTLSGNKTDGPDGQGGAIYANSGTVTISQSTLSGNSTLTSSEGGAIYARFGAVFVSQSTLTFNNASQFQGGAIFSYSAPITITNSIVAGNTDNGTGPDVRKSPNGDDAFTVTNSLIGRNNGTGLTATGTTPGLNGNLIGGDTDALKINPQVGPLTNNGGPTQTHALLINSPAFNRGNNALAVDAANGSSPLTTDQRGAGFARVLFGIVDMGAFESTVLDSPEGTTGADAFVLTYSATTTAGTVTVTMSTPGGPAVNLGTFPMNSPLTINGLGGTDSVRIIGTGSADTIIVNSGTGLTVNGVSLILTSIEDRTLAGAAGGDTYRFDADTALGSWTLDEAGGGTDVVDLALTSTLAVSLNLGLATSQTVNANLSLILGSATHFENAIGGLLGDTITGNTLANRLTGGGGNDTLNGAAGNDTLVGGANDDTYVLGTASATEADIVIEAANQGTDTISFASLTTDLIVNLGSTAAQPVHTNRTLKLNSGGTFENLVGGSGADNLTGNALANRLTGNAGKDTLNGASGNDTLVGGANDDTYVFGTVSAAEADILIEAANQGTDTIFFASATTAVTVNLGSIAVQQVHTNRTLKLNSGGTFENLVGGSGEDSLTGNALVNRLTGGAGNDTLNGAAGNDTLVGGANDDTYVFGTASAAEADILIEAANQGTDTISFASLTTDLTVNLGSTAVQPVHTNRTLKLNSGSTFENATGGSANDVLLGNALGNQLIGGNGHNILVGNAGADTLISGAGRDILIGGLGLDTLTGGSNQNILIAGRTTSDANVTNLLAMHAEWISANAYANRITNLRAGVGVPAVSLRATINVLNDAGEDDSLTGGTGTDWFFRAIDDVITDLFAGETIDVL